MKLDCTAYEDLLFASLDGAVDEVASRRLSRHEAECDRCRALAATLRGEGSGFAGAADDLVADVMGATAGSPCERVALRLATGERDDELLRLHVDGCEECAATERALELMAVELPGLAWMDPGDEFVARVVAATSEARQPAPAPAPMPSRWWSGMGEVLRDLAQRPRIAMESAYAAAAIAVLVLGFPVQSIAELPTRAYNSVRAEGANVEQVLSARVSEFTDFGRSVWSESTARATEILNPDGTDEQSEQEGLRGVLSSARDWLVRTWGPAIGTFLERLAELWNETETEI